MIEVVFLNEQERALLGMVLRCYEAPRAAYVSPTSVARTHEGQLDVIVIYGCATYHQMYTLCTEFARQYAAPGASIVAVTDRSYEWSSLAEAAQ
ncbi:MAG: hypothetical protein Q8S13_12230, partial [Dehalococcoidia bacterium]|nr:hypothetical protein [Dehalococcoidia bacterium]